MMVGSREFVRAGGPWSIAGALLLAALAGCASPGKAAWNLRQVHGPDGSARYTGNLRTEFEERILATGSLGSVAGQRLPSVGSLFGIEPDPDQPPKPIPDPGSVALDNAIELASFDPTKDEEIRALQAEMFGWLGPDSAFPLVRERAVLELGRLGRVLGVDRPHHLPEGTQPADARALAGVLKPLIAAVRNGGDVQSACDAVRALPMDREGLRRAVAAVSVLRFGGREGGLLKLGVSAIGAHSEPLKELHATLEHELVAQALADALNDPVPMVRAAAVQATVVATRNGLPGLLQSAILQGGSEEVLLRAVSMLERYGIPRLSEKGEKGPPSQDELASYHTSWVRLLIDFLRQVPDGRASIAVCKALERISDSGLHTLRSEEWIEWWERDHPLTQDGSSSS